MEAYFYSEIVLVLYGIVMFDIVGDIDYAYGFYHLTRLLILIPIMVILYYDASYIMLLVCLLLTMIHFYISDILYNY